ncbi:MAG: hypothetical protein ABR521_01245 [Gaiellaceae bacterium]
MPADPLDRYRGRVDRFIAALDEEYYLHFAGLKESLELEPIYREYADLTELDQARTLGAAVDGDRGVRELWRFACENYLGGLTRTYAERTAELEATLTATVDGAEIAFRMLRPTIANEEDREKRRRLERARNELTEEHLNPIYAEAAGVERAAVRDLGSETYTDLYTRFGFRLEELAGQCRALLDSTESLYEQSMDRLFRDRVGVSLVEAERWDTARLFRAAKWDRWFPENRMVPALEATLGDLGIDLRGQKNVELDLERRETKSPRAFCVPIEVPGRVVLVIQPQGGVDDWAGLFHEAGHAEHYGNTSADLPVEDRRLGDVTVTEGWAMLLQHLTTEPAWLNRRLDFPRPDEFAVEGATELLFIVRRYAAKLLYELEFHATPDLADARPRYVELLADALRIEPSPTDFLADFDSGYYVTGYLRSWAFEAQMRDFLRTEYGNEWFARREAGSLLRELWSRGSSLDADAMLREVADAPIELEAVAERVRERLR